MVLREMLSYGEVHKGIDILIGWMSRGFLRCLDYSVCYRESGNKIWNSLATSFDKIASSQLSIMLQLTNSPRWPHPRH